MVLNLIFSALAVFHLTYLGSMFDPGVDEQEVEEVRVKQPKREMFLWNPTLSAKTALNQGDTCLTCPRRHDDNMILASNIHILTT